MKVNKTSLTSRKRMPAIMRKTLVAGLACMSTTAIGAVQPLTLAVPMDPAQANYIKNQSAAIALGKALFWDMQVGSDGVQACATCHFHAGADSRTVNQISPGILGGDTAFGNNNLGLPQPAAGAVHTDQALTKAHFPTHKLVNQHEPGDPIDNPGNIISDMNDVISSQGVKLTQFVDIVPGNPVDLGTPIADPVFNNGVENVRRVEPRNTPSVINAVFNFFNFWDGRANNIFNGDNPFGAADPRPHLLSNFTGSLATEELRLRHSALASQAVGPPLSNFEMSYDGRTFPKIGKKMLSLKPLAQQKVDPTDSVLGTSADTNALDGDPATGLTVSYATMIQAAFPDRYWNNTSQKVVYDAGGNPSFQPWDGVTPLTTDEFTQAEANFSFFFGMAVQLYEATLIANETPLDQFLLNGVGGLSTAAQQGFNHFNAFGCLECHDGALMADVDVYTIQGVIDPIFNKTPTPLDQNPNNANDFMNTVSGGAALYDTGTHNTGVRPGGNTTFGIFDYLATNEDVGRGGLTGMGAGLTEVPLGIGMLGLQALFDPLAPVEPLFQIPGLDPTPVISFMAPWVPPLPPGFTPADTSPDGRVANFGSFKTPSLRNVALTGPYMHNGGFSTLRQVVDFYVRGGDFPLTNVHNFDIGMLPINLLQNQEQLVSEMTQFLIELTDQRVAREQAPFDHPELFVPITGTAPVSPGTRDLLAANTTDFQRVAEVGSGGRGIFEPDVGTFLGLNPQDVALVADADIDLIEDVVDNCPNTPNPGQEDTDGDGVGDACDNCITVANGTLLPAGKAAISQRDTDADGYGNMCDADLNNSGTVTITDYILFRNEFGKTAPGVQPYTSTDHADFDGNGLVTISDYIIFRSMYGLAPGPSALAP